MSIERSSGEKLARYSSAVLFSATGVGATVPPTGEVNNAEVREVSASELTGWEKKAFGDLSIQTTPVPEATPLSEIEDEIGEETLNALRNDLNTQIALIQGEPWFTDAMFNEIETDGIFVPTPDGRHLAITQIIVPGENGSMSLVVPYNEPFGDGLSIQKFTILPFSPESEKPWYVFNPTSGTVTPVIVDAGTNQVVRALVGSSIDGFHPESMTLDELRDLAAQERETVIINAIEIEEDLNPADIDNARSLELNIANPERLGEIRQIDSVPITLPNGTNIEWRIHGDPSRLVEAGFFVGTVPEEAHPIVQNLVDAVLIDSPNEINFLSFNEAEAYGGDGRPDENGYRDGESLVRVDLSKGVDVVLLDHPIPELFSVRSTQSDNGEYIPIGATYIDNNSEGRLTIYYFDGEPYPDEEFMRRSYSGLFTIPLSIISEAQKFQGEGNNSYSDLSRSLGSRATSRRHYIDDLVNNETLWKADILPNLNNLAPLYEQYSDSFVMDTSSN